MLRCHIHTFIQVFHHGLDFEANHYLLSALASGTVSGIGNDATHGIYQVIRYGKYEVTYAHLANVFVNFGQTVKAGNIVALSGDRLHFEVKFDGKEINPIDFLTMLYGNVKAMEQTGKTGFPEFETYDMNIANPVLQGNCLVATIDRVPYTIQLPEHVVGAYQAGALPLNTIANAVLAKSDQMRQMAERNYGEQEVRNVRNEAMENAECREVIQRSR